MNNSFLGLQSRCFFFLMFVITSVIVISGMGMAKKLALKDTPTPVSTGALQELQTSESVFTVFVKFE